MLNSILTYYTIFHQSITDYHEIMEVPNPYTEGTIEYMLYKKNQIDTIQWHLEDEIRNPNIDPIEALVIKRKIDRYNQLRTDIVEQIDDYFVNKLDIDTNNNSISLATESIGWALDRLSILALKIYHTKEIFSQSNTNECVRQQCKNRLDILFQQKTDLIQAIEFLIEEIKSQTKTVRVYRQLKMYNDKDFNPVLQAYHLQNESTL